MPSCMSWGTLLGISLIFVALIYKQGDDNHRNDESRNTSDPEPAESDTERHFTRRIAIGVNADVDLIASAIEVLKALDAVPGQVLIHQKALASIKDLQEMVAYSMSTCSGLERHFENKAVFDEIVQAIYKLKYEEFLGGNAGLMAKKFLELSPESHILLAAPIGAKLRQYFDDNVKLVSPPNTKEEVHVILEYGKGEKWGQVKSICANRVIISHDVANSELSSLESFGMALTSYRPSLVVFTGVHMLDGQSMDFWKQRLLDIREFLKTVPSTVPIHLELATVGNLQFLPHLAEELFPYINSLGLNEQELLSLAKSMKADFNFAKIGPKPSIPNTSDLLHWLYSTYGIEYRNNSRLSRVHFHSLSFHILVVPGRQSQHQYWGRSLEAAKAGSKAASLQACDTKDVDSKNFELQLPEAFALSHQNEVLQRAKIEYEPANGYVAWQRDSEDYFMAPVYVCRDPIKTVGLGDAISATGLLETEFNPLQSKKSRKKKK